MSSLGSLPVRPLAVLLLHITVPCIFLQAVLLGPCKDISPDITSPAQRYIASSIGEAIGGSYRWLTRTTGMRQCDTDIAGRVMAGPSRCDLRTLDSTPALSGRAAANRGAAHSVVRGCSIRGISSS